MCCKKYFFNVLLGVQTFHFIKTVQNCKKALKVLKNDCHFRIPHPQINLKQYSNICENELYLFYYVGGWKSVFAKQFNFSKFKNGQFSFFLTFCNYHTL